MSLLLRDVSRRRTLIRLTPLIDVVFILLIFFMLVSSFLEWQHLGIPLQEDPVRVLPAQGSPVGTPVQDSTEALWLELHPEGLRHQAEWVYPEALAALVHTHVQRSPQAAIWIQPMPGVSLQALVTVQDRLRAAGGQKIGWVMEGGRHHVQP